MFCCKQLIKAKLFTVWVCWHTLLVALRWVRAGCIGLWCLSSAPLPSVKLGHLSSHLCSESPCHCCGHSLSDLPSTAFWHLEAKGPQCRWAPLTPRVASKHRGQLGQWNVLHLRAILFSLPIIFIFSLENRHLSWKGSYDRMAWWGWQNWGLFWGQQYLPQPLLS